MLFTPAVEDADVRGIQPHESDAETGACGGMPGEAHVAAALTRARRQYLLRGDAVSAYNHLRPFLSLHAGGSGLRFQRRELEDTAVELLLALGDSRELEAWVSAASEPTGPQRQGRSHKESLYALGATVKEFSALNSAELGQRVAVFDLLARKITPRDDSCAVAERRLLRVTSVFECMTALTRKAHRRDIYLWKHLVHALSAVRCSSAASPSTHTDDHTEQSDSDIVVQAFSVHVSSVVVRCLEYRDRPLESAAKTYGAHRAEFEGTCLEGMKHSSSCVKYLWAQWLAADVAGPSSPLPVAGDIALPILDAAVLLRANGCEHDVSAASNAGCSSRPSTPRNMAHMEEASQGHSQTGEGRREAPGTPVTDVRSLISSSQGNTGTISGDANVVPQTFARFLTVHLLQWLGADALLPTGPIVDGASSDHQIGASANGSTSQPIDALIQRISSHHQQLIDGLRRRCGDSEGGGPLSPLLVLYLVAYSFFFSIFTSTTIAAVYGQQAHAALTAGNDYSNA